MSIRVCHVALIHPRIDRRILFKECATLARAGYDVHLISPPAETAVSVAGVTFHDVPELQGKATAPWRCLQVYRLARREVRADVYHIHEFWLIPFGLAMVWFGGAKVIYDAHEDYASNVSSRARRMPGLVVRLLGRLVAGIEAFAARRMAHVVTVVDSIAERFLTQTPHVTQVRNYAVAERLPQAPPAEQEYRSRDPVVVHTGSISVDRGGDVMLDAMVLLKRRGVAARLVAVDRFLAGGESARQRFFERIGELGVEDVVELVPEVPYDELGRYLSRARVGLSLLVPRTWYAEATPTKIFEYMAYGLPMVANRLACHKTFIADEQAGVLTEFDGESLADGIARLLEDPGKSYTMGCAGFRAFRERYTWESQGRHLLAVYEEVAGPARGACGP